MLIFNANEVYAIQFRLDGVRLEVATYPIAMETHWCAVGLSVGANY